MTDLISFLPTATYYVIIHNEHPYKGGWEWVIEMNFERVHQKIVHLGGPIKIEEDSSMWCKAYSSFVFCTNTRKSSWKKGPSVHQSLHFFTRKIVFRVLYAGLFVMLAQVTFNQNLSFWNIILRDILLYGICWIKCFISNPEREKSFGVVADFSF